MDVAFFRIRHLQSNSLDSLEIQHRYSAESEEILYPYENHKIYVPATESKDTRL